MSTTKVTIGWRVGAGKWRLKRLVTRLGRDFFLFRLEKGYLFTSIEAAEAAARSLGGSVIPVTRKVAAPPPETYAVQWNGIYDTFHLAETGRWAMPGASSVKKYPSEYAARLVAMCLPSDGSCSIKAVRLPSAG